MEGRKRERERQWNEERKIKKEWLISVGWYNLLGVQESNVSRPYSLVNRKIMSFFGLISEIEKERDNRMRKESKIRRND